MSIEGCKLLEFPSRVDARGSLTFAQEGEHYPFAVRRIYYLHGTSEGQRGMHAHRSLEQVFIAIKGAFTLVLDDGARRQTHRLSRPDRALYVCPMLWRELREFTADAVCLVLASAPYDEGDYIRDYDEFKRVARGNA